MRGEVDLTVRLLTFSVERQAPAHAHTGAKQRHNGQVGPDVFFLCSAA